MAVAEAQMISLRKQLEALLDLEAANETTAIETQKEVIALIFY